MSVVIIGAGHSGVAAATALRKLDKDIKITLISNEDNLPYQRPPLSKKTVFSETPSPDLILGKDFYNKNDINLHTNLAVDKINPEKSSIILFSKDIIEYEQLIIATGTKRHELKIPGEDLAKTLYSIKDAQNLSK